MIRTILFIVVMYFLVKVISRLFLKSASKKRRGSGASFFYQTFKNMSDQQKQQGQSKQQKRPGNNNGTPRFEEIEEAEYEDVTEEAKSSKSSD